VSLNFLDELGCFWAQQEAYCPISGYFLSLICIFTNLCPETIRKLEFSVSSVRFPGIKITFGLLGNGNLLQLLGEKSFPETTFTVIQTF